MLFQSTDQCTPIYTRPATATAETQPSSAVAATPAERLPSSAAAVAASPPCYTHSMSHKAVPLWKACVQQLSTATRASSPAAAHAAAVIALRIVEAIDKLTPLPSATFKKLVKDVKVVPLLCQAFNDAAQHPLSFTTTVASGMLSRLLLQAKAAGALGSSPSGPTMFYSTELRGGSSSLQHSSNSSSSSGRPLSNLAAEVHRQLQDSGVVQQLAATMEAVAQQLEADAADSAALAAWWHAEESASVFSTAQQLLSINNTMVYSTDYTSLWLQSGAAAAAARLSLSLLQRASALVQQLAPDPGPQLTLRSGLRVADSKMADCFSHVSAAWDACTYLQAAACVANASDQQHTPGLFSTTHLFELNLARTAAFALWLQHKGNLTTDTSGDGGGSSSGPRGGSSGSSSGGGSSGSSSGGGSSGSSSGSMHSAGGGRASSAVRAWRQAHQQAASLTPLQQQLCLQLGLDARVLLWAMQTASAELFMDLGTRGLLIHGNIVSLWSSEAGRLSWHQQGSGSLQESQQQPPQQPAGPLQRELQLHMLLQCATLPCCLAALNGSNNGSSSDSADLSAVVGPAADFLQQTVHSLTVLPVDFAAAAGRGSQAFPIDAWLEDVLQSLLLLLAQLTWEHQERQQPQQQQQQRCSSESATSVAGASSSRGCSSSSQPGAHTSSSSSMLPGNPPNAHPTRTAAALCVLIGLAEVIKAVCVGWNKAVAAATSAASADTACTLQPTYVAALQHHSTAILAQLDSCVRASHRCAAAGADTGSTFVGMPKTLSSQALTVCLQVLFYNNIRGLPGQDVLVPYVLVTWAQQAGPGSKVQRQLYSLLASLLKLCGDRLVMMSNDAQQLDLSRRCRHAAVDAACMLLCDGATGSSSAAASVHTQQHAPVQPSAVQSLLPSLVVFGRACLQWAQELQLQTDIAFQQTAAAAAGTQLDSALDVCCRWLSSSTPHAVGPTFTGSSTTRLSSMTEFCHAWLSKHIREIAAAGYDPYRLMQQLELLKQAAAKAAAAVAATASQQGPPMAQAVQPLVQQLQAVGAVCSNLAVQAFCNNPSCNNISGPTELQLVSGRSCICAGCRTARFCSRACLKQHWKLHKPVCQALAAEAAAVAAAAAAAAANTEAT